MDTNRKTYELTGYALKLIHHKARKLVGKAGYTQDDVEDIKQNLILNLLKRLPKFDPAKAAYNTFVARVVERKICNLLRDRRTARRDCRREECSLNDQIEDGQGERIERTATISQDDHDLRTGKYARPLTERIDLRVDMAAVLDDLPADLRDAAELLMVIKPAQVARKLGIARSTFYDTHLARLRAAIKARGLGVYMS